MANYRNIIPFIKEKEGGVSHSQHDSARFDPVPDGTGVHTNKGVTWTTFKTMAFMAGYEPTVDLFYRMPDDIWGKIFKIGYWDQVFGDQIISQAIADTLVDWAWASGPRTAIRKMQMFLSITADSKIGPITLQAINDRSQENDRDFNANFSAYKLAWYLSLPNQEANYAGWKNRLTDLFALTNQQTLNFDSTV
jgi:lysozyme family protein